MFHQGVNSAGTYFKLDSGEGDDGSLSDAYRLAGATGTYTLTNRNYPLPLWYRGEDSDEVVINVIYENN